MHMNQDEKSCRLILKKNQHNNHKDDLRQILNEKRGLANIDQSSDDNIWAADVNNNEIAMVEAIKIMEI